MAYFRKYNVKSNAKGYMWSYTADLGRNPRTGKRIQITRRGFETKKEAEAHCAELISKNSKGEVSLPSKTLVKDYLDRWLLSKNKIRKATKNKYSTIIRNHLQPGLGFIELSKLTEHHINELYSSLIKESKLSNTTIADIHAVLKNALNQAVKRRIIASNPADLVESPSRDKKVIEVWDYDEANKFLSFARKERQYIAFLLALTTGMRQSEILGLPWKNVDFSNGTIAVTQTLEHDGKELVPKVKSRHSQRSISIDEDTMNQIKQHKKLIAKEKLLLGPSYEDHNLVIPTSKGTPIIPRNLLRTHYRIIRNSDVRPLDFHSLRHTHATMLLKEGENPKTVAERLGHDVRTLMDTYAHVLPNMQKQTAINFGKRFHKKMDKSTSKSN